MRWYYLLKPLISRDQYLENRMECSTVHFKLPLLHTMGLSALAWRVSGVATFQNSPICTSGSVIFIKYRQIPRRDSRHFQGTPRLARTEYANIHLCIVYKAIWKHTVANADVCVSYNNIKTFIKRPMLVLSHASASAWRRTQALSSEIVLSILPTLSGLCRLVPSSSPETENRSLGHQKRTICVNVFKDFVWVCFWILYSNVRKILVATTKNTDASQTNEEVVTCVHRAP